jgi:hypothetical protein
MKTNGQAIQELVTRKVIETIITTLPPEGLVPVPVLASVINVSNVVEHV